MNEYYNWGNSSNNNYGIRCWINFFGIFCDEFSGITLSGIFIILIGALGLFFNYEDNQKQTYAQNRTKFYASKVASKGYLTDDIKLDIEKDFNSKKLDVGELKIEGTSKNEKSKQIYLNVALKQSYIV